MAMFERRYILNKKHIIFGINSWNFADDHFFGSGRLEFVSFKVKFVDPKVDDKSWMHLQFHVYSLKQTWICDSSMPGIKSKNILPMDSLMAMIPMVEFAKNHLKQIQDYRIFPLADSYHLHWECLSYKIVVTGGIWRTSNLQEKNQQKHPKNKQTNKQTEQNKTKRNNFQMNQNPTQTKKQS